MEIADERRRDAGVHHALLDFRDRCGGVGQVHRHANHFGAGFGQLDALPGGRRGVRRVGDRHRLHDDWSATANLDRTHTDPDRSMKFQDRHVDIS